jgi:hypothetical protein
MAKPGVPAASHLFGAGATRVSIGQMTMLAGNGQSQGIAEELHSTGTCSEIEADAFGFGEAEGLFEGARRQ